MKASVLSVCVGMPRTVAWQGQDVTTGIFKSPVSGRRSVSFLNIDGDGQADLSVHGGRDKAVYVYAAHHVPYWLDVLGRDELEPSQFGENLLVSGLDERNVRIGDRLRIGLVIAVVAQPRLPCFKLGLRMNDDTFPQRFLQAARPGYYLRIEEEGDIGEGDGVEIIEPAEHGITIHDLWQTVHKPGEARATPSECLDNMPHLDEGWQRRLRKAARRPAS